MPCNLDEISRPDKRLRPKKRKKPTLYRDSPNAGGNVATQCRPVKASALRGEPSMNARLVTSNSTLFCVLTINIVRTSTNCNDNTFSLCSFSTRIGVMSYSIPTLKPTPPHRSFAGSSGFRPLAPLSTDKMRETFRNIHKSPVEPPIRHRYAHRIGQAGYSPCRAVPRIPTTPVARIDPIRTTAKL